MYMMEILDVEIVKSFISASNKTDVLARYEPEKKIFRLSLRLNFIVIIIFVKKTELTHPSLM